MAVSMLSQGYFWIFAILLLPAQKPRFSTVQNPLCMLSFSLFSQGACDKFFNLAVCKFLLYLYPNLKPPFAFRLWIPRCSFLNFTLSKNGSLLIFN